MQNAKLDRLYKLAVDDLTKVILPWWEKYTVDEENGGFYGAVNNDNIPDKEHSKFITLNARLIWTFSSVYRVLGDEKYLKLAKRAYDYFVAHFYDRKNGGWYSRVDYKGNCIDDSKYIYGNAFAIYGLAEYARTTGDKEALRLAMETRDKLEQFVYDPVYKGYYESTFANWKVNPWGRGVNRSPSDIKTMNTHLHMLEAYTCLARVDDSPKTRASLRQQLYVMLNKIVDRDSHHYFYFQDRAWNPTTPEISFGHDIEGSWLMMECAEVLGEPEAHHAARDTCVNIARACYDQGWQEDGFMVSEYDPRTGHASDHVSWWEHNETVVGFLNAWEMTGEEKFLDAANKTFDFINNTFVDHEKGGWLAILDPDRVTPRTIHKCSDAICPYHNCRMDMEIIERYRKLTK